MALVDLIKKLQQYMVASDIDKIKEAYYFAEKAHAGQFRVSGEPYITHPLEVAEILSELNLDKTTIIAALLHDVVEDTEFTLEQITKQFGADVALLVDGVTKLSRIEFTSKEEQQAENFRKMFLAMAKDVRVILIKLADRLHNMRTIQYKPPHKQREIAIETLEIFAPLAHRLGIYRFKWELEDVSFRILKPQKYYELVTKVAKKRKEREEYIAKLIEELNNSIAAAGIKGEIEGRPKHFYSIYHKMTRQGKDFNEIFDLMAVRVLVDSVKDCYGVLGIIHNLWTPIPGRFKDYIAMPKPNMYQSLHTTIIGPQGDPVEIQIRTWEMHRVAEFGVAAHWLYKEGNTSGKISELDKKFAWVRQFLDWQTDLKDAHEYIESLKIDLFTDEVFVFTPKGAVIDLPAGSCAVDFAYRIHTDIGNNCVGAKVNAKMVPLNYRLQNGDIIEILTSKQGNGPNWEWLGMVRTSQAKNRIRQWFKKEKRDETIIAGRDILEKEIKRQGFKPHELIRKEELIQMGKRINCDTEDDVYAAIGYGAITVQHVINKLREAWTIRCKQEKEESYINLGAISEIKPQKPVRDKEELGIRVDGLDNALIRLSKCCSPVVGDEIVGYVTRGRGVSVHRKDCPNIKTLASEPNRVIPVSWASDVDMKYAVEIEVMANDRGGLMKDISDVIAEHRVYIRAATVRTVKNQTAIFDLTIEIRDLVQLGVIMRKLNTVKDVFSVRRVTPT